MARKRRDDDEDYDDDEYVPRKGRDREEGGGGSAMLLFGVLGLVALVVIGGAFFLLGSRRDVSERAADERAAAEHAAQNAAPTPMVQPKGPARAEPVWPRLIGTWSRQPAAKGDNEYPYLFVFREDRTGSMTRINYDGNPIQKDITVEILSDGDNTLRAAMLVPMGRYGYSFTMKPDGTMLFDDGKGGLVFRRAK